MVKVKALRFVLRATLFGEYELTTEANYLQAQEESRAILHFPSEMFRTHSDCESYVRMVGLIPSGAVIVRL